MGLQLDTSVNCNTETELEMAHKQGASDFRGCIINWYEAENDKNMTAESLIEIIKILEI